MQRSANAASANRLIDMNVFVRQVGRTAGWPNQSNISIFTGRERQTVWLVLGTANIDSKPSAKQRKRQ